MDSNRHIRLSRDELEVLGIINDSIVSTPVIATSLWNIQGLITSQQQADIWSVLTIRRGQLIGGVTLRFSVSGKKERNQTNTYAQYKARLG
jgi:hypothetical protein